jgi:hypothetical protein
VTNKQASAEVSWSIKTCSHLISGIFLYVRGTLTVIQRKVTRRGREISLINQREIATER